MKLRRKLSALLAALLIVFSVFGSTTVSFAAADGAAPALSAEKSGDQVAVELTATEELKAFLGMSYTLTYDKDAFTMKEADVTRPDGLKLTVNEDEGLVVITGEDSVDISAGKTLSKVLLTPKSGYEKTKKYTFKVEVTEAYNDDFDDYSWNEKTLTTSWQEEKSAEHTHTYGEPTWSWTGDDEKGYTAAKATFICEDKDDTQVKEASVKSKTTSATSTAEGKTVYTARVEFQDKEYTDTKTVTIPKLAEGEEETITFIDTKGKETVIKTSEIESSEQQASGNYLLKDVLTTVGVTKNLADCRYKLSSSDGYTVYLDANDFENIALFYKEGWRSTVEDATNYNGGWYKVSGLATITAENHSFTDGVCKNTFNLSRTDTEECGAEKESITFVDTKGKETVITSNVIESVGKTENGNYLLKDVLTAAGITKNLADCRYKLEGSGDYVIYLDAEDFENLSLYYEGGWRSSVEDTTNYTGGWYRVGGLISITAENHSFADGVCENTINISKKETEVCGAEKESLTFVDTKGKETVITSDVIESVGKTENGNYLLKDVLTAAGITKNLADCRYKLEGSGDYVIYLDAEDFENLSLYYEGGWRSSVENTTNYTGGWYRVGGLISITAENHSFADGVCENTINISKKETEVCGAEKESLTFVDTSGKETVITSSVIESVGKTENGNYLLKDVLTAAGITKNLADCRYKLEGSGDYVIYLDAEDFENLSLYYEGGWRSSVEDTTNYTGGWYRVGGLFAITAENHTYGADGLCANAINISKKDTVVCGYEETHQWDEGVVTIEPTCEKAGEKTYTCKNHPDVTKTEAVAPLGHDWDEGKVTTEPTCETAGEKTYTCKNDATHTKTEIIAATGHDWDGGKVTKEATCTTAGEKVYTCKNDAAHTKTEEIAALGHKAGEKVQENTVEPTFTTEGSYEEVVYCTVCGEEISRTKVTIEKITYYVQSGDGTTWTKQGTQTADFTFKRSWEDEKTFANFTGIQVDGKDLAGTAYNVEKGSVIVKLKPEYLETLAVGEHTLTALFRDSDEGASLHFNILAKNDQSTAGQTNQPSVTPNNTSGTGTYTSPSATSMTTPTATGTSQVSTPRTGDTSNAAVWMIVIICAAAAGGTLVYRRRQYHR